MDENSKIVDGGATKSSIDESAAGNPNSDVTTANSNAAAGDNLTGDNLGGAPVTATDDSSSAARGRQSSRTPFTNLSQVDADLALARALQEQERAYMMLSMNGGGIGYGRWDHRDYIHDDEDDDFGDSHDHDYDEVDDEDEDDDDEDEESGDDVQNYYDEGEGEDEDAFDVHAHADSVDNNAHTADLDPSSFPDDEAYARALQDFEEQEMARLLAMAGITEREIVDVEDHGGNSQVDIDRFTYEELLALGEVVGTASRGLTSDMIASLPSTNYKSQNTQEAESDSCVICRLDYEDGDALTTLPCKHAYHSDCINKWLKIKKACPVCSTEVSSSGNS